MLLCKKKLKQICVMLYIYIYIYNIALYMQGYFVRKNICIFSCFSREIWNFPSISQLYIYILNPKTVSFPSQLKL